MGFGYKEGKNTTSLFLSTKGNCGKMVDTRNSKCNGEWENGGLLLSLYSFRSLKNHVIISYKLSALSPISQRIHWTALINRKLTLN